MKTYELLAIFKPNINDEEINKAVEKTIASLVEFNGKVDSTDKIGRKKLAYEIQNFRDGFFVSSVLSIPAENVAEFRRQLRLNDNILRTMFMETAAKAKA